MLSRRKLFSMVLIMVVLFALFMFAQVYISSATDHNVNPYAVEVTLRRSDSWDADGGGQAERQTVLIGSEERGAGDIVSQWCTYAKRPLQCFRSLEEYMQAEDSDTKVLCIDPDCLSLPADEARLAELTERDLTIIFCSLPEVNTIAGSLPLCALLGIEDVLQQQTPLTGIYLYEGFLLGGEALYGQDTGMEVDLDIPWYKLESGTKV